jgi:predicted O-methyltransferase YrrM
MNLKELYAHNCKHAADIREHLPYLAGLAHGAETIVELGFRTGRSTSAFLFGNPDVNLYVYDIAPCQQARAVFENLTQFFVFEQANSLEVSIPECDLLFIDSYHSYSQLYHELDMHCGYADTIVMHDTETFGHEGEDKNRPGLQQAIREFMEKHEEWGGMVHFKNNNGLTMIRRGR